VRKPKRLRVDPDLLAAVYKHAAKLCVALPSDEVALRWAMARAAKVRLAVAEHAPPGVCEGCRKPRPHLGRFLDDAGKQWSALCGGCKNGPDRTLEEIAADFDLYARSREEDAVYAETGTSANMPDELRRLLREALS
jgi:hypothetical protein